MKHITRLFLAFFIVSNICSCVPSEPQDKETPAIENPTNIEVDNNVNLAKTTLLLDGNYSYPVFSPNGNRFSYTEKNGINLYIKELKVGGASVRILNAKGLGNTTGWAKGGEAIYFKDRSNGIDWDVKEVDVVSKNNRILPNIPYTAVFSALGLSDTLFYIGQQSLKVYAEYGGKKWQITNKEGQFYQALLSPNLTYLVAHNGSQVQLFTVDGRFIRALGTGIATAWSPDSRFLIGFQDESADGQQITGSDLYLFDIEKDQPIRLTQSPDVFEMWPSWSPKGNKILFADDRNGGIYEGELDF